MKKILILFFLICSLTAGADKWYIATAANGGSNTNGDGSVGAPWLTLKHAADTVTGANFVGDTIMVGVGTFIETAQSALGLGVSIYGAGATSIIKSNYAGNYADGVIALVSPEANPVDGNQSISYIKLDGDALTGGSAINVEYRNNVLIHNCTFQDFNYRAITFHGNNSTWPAAPTVNYSTGNQVYNSTITNCAAGGSANYSLIYLEGQQDCLIHDNALSSVSRASNSTPITALHYKGLKIYNNTITTTETVNGTWWLFACELHWCWGNSDIYDNDFNGAGVLDLVTVSKGTYTYGIKIHNNTFDMSARVASNFFSHEPIAINLEHRGGLEYVYIYNNYFNNFPVAIRVDVTSTSPYTVPTPYTNIVYSNIFIYYNIVNNYTYTDYVSYLGGIEFKTYGIEAGETVTYTNINILNNIINPPLDAAGYGIFWSANGSETITSVYIRNNIITGMLGHPVYFYKSTGSPVITNGYSQNNLFFDNDDGNVVNWGTVTVTNKTENGNVTTAPLFIGTLNYHLQSGSPAIDAGLDVSLTTDYDGNVVPSGLLPDIGVYEYASTPPPLEVTKYVVNDGKYQMYNGKLVINR